MQSLLQTFRTTRWDLAKYVHEGSARAQPEQDRRDEVVELEAPSEIAGYQEVGLMQTNVNASYEGTLHQNPWAQDTLGCRL